MAVGGAPRGLASASLAQVGTSPLPPGSGTRVPSEGDPLGNVQLYACGQVDREAATPFTGDAGSGDAGQCAAVCGGGRTAAFSCGGGRTAAASRARTTAAAASTLLGDAARMAAALGDAARGRCQEARLGGNMLGVAELGGGGNMLGVAELGGEAASTPLGDAARARRCQEARLGDAARGKPPGVLAP